MKALYDLVKVNDFGKEKEEKDAPEYQARYISRGTIENDMLFTEVTMTSGFKRGMIEGVLSSLTECIIDNLKKGFDVQLGELGFFSLSATSKRVKNRKEIRAESIHFNGLNFRMNSYLRNRLKYLEFEKVDEPMPTSSNLTVEQRAKRLKQHLEARKCITRAEYERLTGSLRRRAIDDLNRFLAEGWIEKHGAGRTVVYMLA